MNTSVPRTLSWSLLPTPRWSLVRCLISIVVAMAMVLLAIPPMIATMVNPSILGAFGVMRGDPMYGSLNALFEKLLSLVLTLAVMLLVLRPVSREIVRIRLQPLVRIVAIGLIGAVVLNLCVYGWDWITGVKEAGGEAVKAFGVGQGLASDLALVAAIILLAPVYEELLFRAMLYLPLRTALDRFGRTVAVFAAGALSAFLFASIHLDGSQLRLFPVYVIYGLVTAAAYELSGSLIGPVVLHASSNAWAFLSPGASAVVSPTVKVAAVVAFLLAIPLAWLSGAVLDALGGDKDRTSH